MNFLGATKTLLSYNAFAYCENDVVNCEDSDGCIAISTTVWICIAVGALIGGGVGGYVAWKNCKLKKNRGVWVLGGILMGAVIGGAIGAVVGMAGEAVFSKLISAGAKITYKTGFGSFNKLKASIGRAGNGRAWHHILEQTSSNVKKFGSRMIHNTKNVVNIPHGKGTLHSKISGYYSSKQPFTKGQTVRKWLSTQSYKKQYEFGMKKLLEFAEELGIKIILIRSLKWIQVNI